MKKSKGERILNLFTNVFLIGISIITIYPLWYILIASVSDPAAIANGKVILVPSGFNLVAYQKIMENKQLWIG